MGKELKPCPFCGGEDTEIVPGIRGDWYMGCLTCDYQIRCSDCTEEEIIRYWNTRPAADSLKAENAELRYIVDQFAQWYNENGCPKHIDNDFPCSAEKEYKDDPETDGDFDERDCWKEEHEAGCWVEYYRWKYWQKAGKDTNISTKNERN